MTSKHAHKWHANIWITEDFLVSSSVSLVWLWGVKEICRPFTTVSKGGRAAYIHKISGTRAEENALDQKNSLLLFVLGQRRRTIHNVNSWVYKFHQQLRIPLHFPPPRARSWKMSHTKNSFLDISIKEKQNLTTSLYPWEIPVLQLLLSTKIQGFISYSKLTVTKTGDTYQFFLVDTLSASKSGQAWCLH